MSSRKPKVLIFDIETSPKLAYVWGMWKQNVSMGQFVHDWYMLCWCAKWLGEEDYFVDSLHYHDLYKKDPMNDKKILESLWKLLDEADYVIGHNGDRFDVPSANARFIQQGMQPPSAYKTVDTLKIAKAQFKFTSNRLDALGEFLKVGRKIDTGGFKLWKDIVQHQDLDAFDRMVAYNEQDVFLLEDVYNKLKPWNKQAIPMGLHEGGEIIVCNSCGSESVKKHGTYSTKVNTYQRYYCNDCGHTMRSRKADKVDKSNRDNILVTV